MPTELSRSSLLKNAVRTAALIGVLIGVVLLAPGLGAVREQLVGANPAWLGIAVAFEALSFGSYVLMFAPIFCRGMSMRRSWQIAGSELAMGSIVPASGIGGLALGAWVLHEGGMSTGHIAHRSVAFFLIKSSVNFVAVAIVGLIAFAGVGPDLSPALTLLPACLSIALIGAVILIPRLGPGRKPGEDDSKPRRLWLKARAALVTGTTESGIVLRRRDWRVIVGAIGYWAFDNAVLFATFAAFGFKPALIVVLLGYLIGQLGGLLPIPGGIGGIDGGLIGTLIVYGAPAAVTTVAVLAYRLILFWLPLLLGSVAFLQLLRDMPREGELSVRGAEGASV